MKWTVHSKIWEQKRRDTNSIESEEIYKTIDSTEIKIIKSLNSFMLL